MTAELITTSTRCSCCGRGLDLLELHFFDDGKGHACCATCEEQWHRELQAWVYDNGPMPREGT